MRLRLGMKAGAAVLGATLAACTQTPPPKPVPVVVEEATRASGWMGIASTADKGRISQLSIAWAQGLSVARQGHARDIADEGDLLKQTAGLLRPAPTPGSYRCRLVTLGRDRRNGPAFERFKPFFCYVALEGELFTIVKQTGSQRPAGRLWEDDVNTRLIFLGSLALGNEDESRGYGVDPKRDMAGIFERIGPFRWRLVIPFPQDGAKLDVFELTPVNENLQPQT